VKRLIINADDFGLTPGVNQAIVDLHQSGALTSTTLMATANERNTAIQKSRQLSSLGIGCHVILVDGAPISETSQLPTLTLPDGEFRPTLGRFVSDLILGRIRESEIEAEAEAQIQSLQKDGIKITHLDTHKHTHMFARVLRPLLRAALRCGVPAIRNPFEPQWSIAATENAPLTRSLEVKLLNTQQTTFLKLVQQAGLITTQGAIGVLATGTLDTNTLNSLLKAIPDGTWELVCHPGYPDPALAEIRTKLRASRATEHEALLNLIPKLQDVHLIHFGQIDKR
jgi:predicted glycoside hydrolase/deacetylase ChbG (UPF0249 family)